MVGKLALVTGATSGIGQEVCKLLATKGIDLIILGRDNEQLLLLQNHLSQFVKVQMIQADLNQHEDQQRVVSILREQTPNLVINNAGFGLYGEALNHSTKQQLSILEVNGKAVLEFTLEAGRALIAKKQKGIILNVSSAAGFQILPGLAVYAAAKAFVNHFSQALDFEFKRDGVRVLTICPGRVMTNFQKRAGGEIKNTSSLGLMTPAFVAEQIWSQIEEQKPLFIINWYYRLLTFLSFFMSKNWIAKKVVKTMSKHTLP